MDRQGGDGSFSGDRVIQIGGAKRCRKADVQPLKLAVGLAGYHLGGSQKTVRTELAAIGINEQETAEEFP